MISGEIIESLSRIILSINSRPDKYAVYIAGRPPWNEETSCAILNPENVEDIDVDDVPGFAAQHNLSYMLSVAEIQDIVSNTLQQKQEATINQLVLAVNFYYQNDAFINWNAIN